MSIMTANLQEAAQILKTSPYFNGRSPEVPHVQKQMIFLALSGDKLASNAIDIDTTASAHVDDTQKLLTNIGLHHHVVARDDGSVEAFVSRDPHAPELLAQSENTPLLFGLLLGFPATAVQAFADEENSAALMDFDAERELFAQHDVPYDEMPTFRLSAQHGEEEILVMKRWWQTLREYDLV
jgi:hypothetical protein